MFSGLRKDLELLLRGPQDDARRVSRTVYERTSAHPMITLAHTAAVAENNVARMCELEVDAFMLQWMAMDTSELYE